MKLKTLMEQLSGLDPELDVLLSSDGLGKDFFHLSFVDADNVAYCEENSEIEIGLRELTPEYEYDGFTEADVAHDGKPCVIFWP